MQKSTLLMNSIKAKMIFDPNNQSHMKMYAEFIKNRTWSKMKTCPFVLEEGFYTIPGMINYKIAMKTLDKHL